MGEITVLIGGVRSGKSSFAVEMGVRHAGRVSVVATAEAIDAEMVERIQRHRAERPTWPVVEASIELANAITHIDDNAFVIVDCITVWVANVMHHRDTSHLEPLVSDFISTLKNRSASTVIVTNEVGLGVHPSSELGREYRDALGAVNRSLVDHANRALFFVAGQVVKLNDPWSLL